MAKSIAEQVRERKAILEEVERKKEEQLDQFDIVWFHLDPDFKKKLLNDEKLFKHFVEFTLNEY